ncbi:MAG: hypothetical protein JNK56_30765 [Myxococcales bacterium]|nr:hypothetical protein [Myxococcales bacterium]
MVMTDDTRIHGIDTSYAPDGGLLVSYVYPGALEVRLAAGVTMPAADRGRERRIVLGTCLHDPDAQDPRDDRFWRWEATTKPGARIWAQHVMAVDAAAVRAAGTRSLVYEYGGEVVLVWGFIPSRADELELLAGGFRPALATWRAPTTVDTRRLATSKAQVLPVSAGAFGGAPRTGDVPGGEVGEWIEHAWMRWAALMDTRGLQVERHFFEIQGPAQRDGDTLVLRFRKGKDDLRVVLDAARHPLIYDVTVSVGARGTAKHLGALRGEQQWAGLAWEDFPRLVEEIGGLIAAPVPVHAATSEPAANSEPRARLQPAKVEPRARKTTKKTKAASAGPRPAMPVAPSWIDAVLDAFNRVPGPRLALQRTRANGAVFVVHAEGATRDRSMASIDVLAEQIEEVRWIDASIRSPQQEEILARMDQALEAAAEAPEGGRPSPLNELIAMMRNRGLVQLGVDVDATSKLDRTDGYRPLAEALRDLAEPSGITPAELQDYLERAGLMAAAEVAGRAVGPDPPPLRTLMQTLWAELDEAMPLWKVPQSGPKLRVPEECLFEDSGHTIVLIAGARPQMTLQRARVRVLERPEDSAMVLVEDTTDSIAAGDALHRGGDALFRVVLGKRPVEFLFEVNRKVREFEATLARAPQALEDVRRLLFWSAAMIDAPRCQGELKAATQRSFQLARSYYETARKRLIEGRPGDAVRQMHEALRRISSSAAELAMNCAEGQLAITPPSPLELVRPGDAAAFSG